MQADTIDRIYEASFIPELWPSILDEIAAQTEARGGLLFTVRDRILNWTSSDDIEDDFHSYVTGGWFSRCGRKLCMFKKAHSSFMIENDYWTEEEFQSNEIYQKFFRPRDLGCSAGTGFQVPTGDNIVFSVERSHRHGPLERKHIHHLNSLRPHIARSALVSARLGLKAAQGASEALNKIGLPTLLLNSEGHVVESSHLDDTASEYIIWGANNRMALSDKKANNLLVTALETLSLHPEKVIRSFPIRGQDGQPSYVGHIIPISRSAHDLFAHSYAVFVMTPLNVKHVPPVELVRSLFDFTASEARVARGLAAGNSLENIAQDGDVAITTVRTQLRNVMEKTGCSRQAEVVALMANISLQRQDAPK
ncbi:DNA-binding CsgD family transcriptional regulator [Litorimonas taeanensis]|uniref:DNA-binding CsgD family transcriptional regulator n=1 Tax=Litorimonas taeanensis TaxID=568099 RepID=A0A420WD20_9PROT|nr:LuxR C-terminal-related transcriptional regulator [Litorimonas taeanensis]RKQ68919.1 DNA-binding CsgD family transcriptional regulator [Litorimonas taeanensis]